VKKSQNICDAIEIGFMARLELLSGLWEQKLGYTGERAIAVPLLRNI
jgi:hypothetical protein